LLLLDLKDVPQGIFSQPSVSFGFLSPLQQLPIDFMPFISGTG
jgi:hypothetical protein